MNAASLKLANCVIATFKTGTTSATPITRRTLTHELIEGVALNLTINHGHDFEGYDVREVKSAILSHERAADAAYFTSITANHNYVQAYRAYCAALESEISS